MTEARGDRRDRYIGIDQQCRVGMSQSMNRHMRKTVPLSEFRKPSCECIGMDRCAYSCSEKSVMFLPPVSHLQLPLRLPFLIIF